MLQLPETAAEGRACTVELHLARYQPNVQAKRFWTVLEIKTVSTRTVLDLLRRLSCAYLPNLGFRYVCGKGVCGGCGLTINGKPTLACTQRLDELSNKIIIEPLYYFPTLYDLVVDFQPFWQKLQLIRPSQDTTSSPSSAAQKKSLHLLKTIRMLSTCNACGLCCSACPQYGLHKEFIGPSALISAYLTELEIRDKQTERRRNVVSSSDGIWRCSFVNACSEVCPKQIDVGASIQQLKLKAALQTVLSKWRKPST